MLHNFMLYNKQLWKICQCKSTDQKKNGLLYKKTTTKENDVNILKSIVHAHKSQQSMCHIIIPTTTVIILSHHIDKMTYGGRILLYSFSVRHHSNYWTNACSCYSLCMCQWKDGSNQRGGWVCECVIVCVYLFMPYQQNATGVLSRGWKSSIDILHENVHLICT